MSQAWGSKKPSPSPCTNIDTIATDAISGVSTALRPSLRATSLQQLLLKHLFSVSTALRPSLRATGRRTAMGHAIHGFNGPSAKP